MTNMLKVKNDRERRVSEKGQCNDYFLYLHRNLQELGVLCVCVCVGGGGGIQRWVAKNFDF